MPEPQSLPIAVALMLTKDKQVLLSWNESWEAFVLPMSKLKPGPPVETSESAAIRAAAEAVHFPVRKIQGTEAKETRTLQLSLRDGEIKDYRFIIVPVEVHPDFASSEVTKGLLCFAEKILDGAYQPMSPSVLPILQACTQWGWI